MSAEQDEFTALQDSLRVAKTLKEQNEELHSALNDVSCINSIDLYSHSHSVSVVFYFSLSFSPSIQLKEEYASISCECAAARSECARSISEKKALETDCKNLYEKWNDELRVQAVEFEKLQSEMIPNSELELFRVRIVEELESSYFDQTQWLKQEMAKYRTLWTQSLREVEVSKLKHENTQSALREQLHEERVDFEREVKRLQLEKEEIQKEAVDQTKRRELDKVQREKGAMEKEVECLRTEIEGLESGQSALRTEAERLKCQQIETRSRLRGQLAVKQTECDGLRAKYDDLSRELEESKMKGMGKEREFENLQHRHRELKAQIEAKKEEIRTLCETANKKENALKQRWTADIDALKANVVAMEQQLSASNVERERLKLEVEAVHNRHLAKIQALKQEHFATLNQVVGAKQESERKQQELDSKFAEFEASTARELDRLTKELQSRSARMEQMEEEQRCTAERAEKSKAEIQELLNDVSCLKRENAAIEEEHQSLTKKHREILDANYKLTAAESARKTQIEFLEHDLQEMNGNIDHKLTAFTKKYEQRIKALTEELEEQKEGDSKTVDRLKREKAKYKKLANGAKLKIAAITKELSKMQRNNETERRAKDIEIQGLHKQLTDALRQRDHLMMQQNCRVTMDNGIGIGSGTLSRSQKLQRRAPLPTSDVVDVELLLNELQSQQKRMEKESDRERMELNLNRKQNVKTDST